MTIHHIIRYYAYHKVPDRLRDKVLKRLADTCDDMETDAIYREIWEAAGNSTLSRHDVKSAYNRELSTLGMKSSRPKYHQWLRVAAVALPLLIATTFAGLYFYNHAGDKQVAEAALTHIRTNSSSGKSITFADGTKVMLGPSSEITFPSSFKGGSRNVNLSGEAFFDIAHNASQPFHLSTQHLEVTDMGTSFGVSAYSSDAEVSVTLKTGRVRVKVGSIGKSYELKPDDKLIYNIAEKSVRMEWSASDDEGTGWRNRRVMIDDKTLEDVVGTLSTVYGVKFVFRTNHHKTTRITAHFNRGETLEGSLQVIRELIPGLSYKIKGNNVVME